MDKQHQTDREMDGGPGTSRGLAALHATGEEDCPAVDNSVTNEVTGLNPAGRPATDDRRRIQGRINSRNNARLGTWNVQTLYQTGKLIGVIREMRRCEIRVLGVAETHWTGRGHYTTAEGELVVFSGGDNHRAGVGVIFSREASSSMESYKAVNDRVLYVRGPHHSTSLGSKSMHRQPTLMRRKRRTSMRLCRLFWMTAQARTS
jgi:hypothetical protein